MKRVAYGAKELFAVKSSLTRAVTRAQQNIFSIEEFFRPVVAIRIFISAWAEYDMCRTYVKCKRTSLYKYQNSEVLSLHLKAVQ